MFLVFRRDFQLNSVKCIGDKWVTEGNEKEVAVAYFKTLSRP
jgi:hypothetical protein